MTGSIYTAYLYTLPVGFILVQKSEEDWTIRGTFVSEWVRGKGVGSLLLDQTIKDFRKSGKECFWVNISEGAESFYLKHGFQLLAKRKDFPDQTIGVYSNKSLTVLQGLLIKKYRNNCRTLTGQDFQDL